MCEVSTNTDDAMCGKQKPNTERCLSAWKGKTETHRRHCWNTLKPMCFQQLVRDQGDDKGLDIPPFWLAAKGRGIKNGNLKTAKTS